MDKLLNKWYFGIVVIPILINLLTSKIGLPDLFREWDLTLISSLTFLTVILSTEYYILWKKHEEVLSKPKTSDKRIIRRLLNSLDVDMFQIEIKEQDSWDGYSKEAVRKTIAFSEEAGLISNQTSDKKLNSLVFNLKEAIDNFNRYSSTKLYSDHEHFYTPAKENERLRKEALEVCPIMNKKAKYAFEQLELLQDYLNKKNYL